MPRSILHLIEAKRDGAELSDAAMREAADAFRPGSGVPEYQLGAFLMALFLNGLADAEVPRLCFALRDTGAVLSLPPDPHRPVVDKHSTGGVGDKVTLPLVPLLACLGFRVPMISGRGLGITGGTLDKLDSIPGFRAAMPLDRLVETVERLGGVISGDSTEIAPADNVMYGLRNATGTVDSVPITAASILSNKLAEGLDALVLDAKFGAAATTRPLEDARTVARAMVRLGSDCGVNTRALLTDMDTPLGRSAGNWLEVVESVDCLEGRGPDDLRTLVVECAASLLVQTGLAADAAEAQARCRTMLDSGAPRRRFDDILAAHGADVDTFTSRLAQPPPAPHIVELTANRSGYVSTVNARIVGVVVRDLGAGRVTADAPLDHDVGVDALRKPGEPVEAGDTLARVHARTEDAARAALAGLRSTFTLSDAPPPPRPLILETLGP